MNFVFYFAVLIFSQFANNALRFRNVGGKWVNMPAKGVCCKVPGLKGGTFLMKDSAQQCPDK